MKKNDNIKLDVLSGIDERLIDEATDSRITYTERIKAATTRARKKFIAFGSIAASFILMLGILFTVLGRLIVISPQIPVYQGMTVRRLSQDISNTVESDGGIELLSTAVPTSDKHGDRPEWSKPHTNIKDMVDLLMPSDNEVKYYVTPGETFIIEIHISNPKDYEIQSFTLNGKKYANYMFKEGSTMEKLLLEVTAPATSGYLEYTIDAIKYIDGTKIKDVDMSGGNKSITVGVAYPDTPVASVTEQRITATSLNLTVNVFDPHSLTDKNELAIFLSDGERIVDRQILQVGDNSITFPNLLVSQTYEYGIIAAFDMADGNDLHKEWLLTDSITTAEAYSIGNIVTTVDSVSFKISDKAGIGEILSVSLYDSITNELVRTSSTITDIFENLLSDHSYDLYVDFSYMSNGEQIKDHIVKKGIETPEKTAPVLNFGTVIADKTSVSYSVVENDPDGVLTTVRVDLLKDGEIFKEGTPLLNGLFEGLISNQKYTLKFDYTYDLNDGKGKVCRSITKDFTTGAVAPILDFASVTSDKTSITYLVEAIDSDGVLHITSVLLSRADKGVKENGTLLNGRFEGLLSDTDYTVTVNYTYDLNDGQGEISRSITKDIKTLEKTEPVLNFGNINADKTSVSYLLDATDPDGILTVTAVELLKGGERVRENGRLLSGSFDTLLSNTIYTLKINYSYDLNDGQGAIFKSLTRDVTTGTKATPTVSVSDLSTTAAGVTGRINIADVDSVCTITSVGIYKDGVLVENNPLFKIDFSGLESYTDYEIKVSYSYDFDDGTGIKTGEISANVKTTPYLALNSVSIINTSAVSVGETIYLQLNLSNPSNAVLNSIVTNGTNYNIDTSISTPTMFICPILNNGQFSGGETTLTVEKLTATFDGNTYTFELDRNNTASIFIHGIVDVEDVSIVVYEDGAYKKIDYLSEYKTTYLLIELQNKTGYTVDSATVNSSVYTNLTKLDDEHYLITVPETSLGANVFRVSSVNYTGYGVEKSVTIHKGCSVFMLSNTNVHYISTPEDLLNMNSGYYYKLKNDIDLSGIEWHGGEFYGVFDGRGYSIKNMSYVGTVKNSNAYLGLFSEGAGVIENLKLENVKFIVNLEGDSNTYGIIFGGIVARQRDSLVINNCSVDENSLINVDGIVGGILGDAARADLNIKNCANYATINGSSAVGGIVGFIYNSPNTVTNCVNYGTISNNFSSGECVGGIVGTAYGPAVINSCINNGYVSGSARIGGIAGTAHGLIILNCVNNGAFNGYNHTDGIAGEALNATILNCKNNGNRIL